MGMNSKLDTIIYTVEQGKIENPTKGQFNKLTKYREDGPAFQRFFSNGQLKSEAYYEIPGKNHREDGPAYTEYDRKGNKIMDQWYNDGKMHRIDGPAETYYYTNGNVKLEGYLINGERHRDPKKGPALIAYFEKPTGSIEYVVYYVHDKKHRDGGPAEIDYFSNGEIKSEKWYNKGVLQESKKENKMKNKIFESFTEYFTVNERFTDFAKNEDTIDHYYDYIKEIGKFNVNKPVKGKDDEGKFYGFTFTTKKPIKKEPEQHIGEIGEMEVKHYFVEDVIKFFFNNSGYDAEITSLDDLKDLLMFESVNEAKYDTDLLKSLGDLE